MKNWLRFFGICCSVCLFISGCRIIHIDEQEQPEVTQQEVEMAVSKFIPKEFELLDSKTSKLQPIMRHDVDGDGISEGVAILTPKGVEGRYDFLIMKRNPKRQWEKWSQYAFRAEELLSVEMKDVTKDKRSELLITVRDKKAKKEKLIIFQLSKNKKRTLLNQAYDQKVIDDFQRDGSYEVILFYVQRDQKRRTVHTDAEMYDYRDNTFVAVDRVRLEGEAKKGNIHTGKVSPSVRGILVDLSIGTRGGGTTKLLVPTKSILLQKFDPEKSPYSYKFINEASRDVNQDGILEFVILEQPKGTERVPPANIPYVYNWYQWVKGNERKLVMQIYEDLNAGFRLQYPKKWNGLVKIEAQPQQNQVTFYYGKSNHPIKKEWKLFTLKKYTQKEWNILKQAQKSTKGKTDQNQTNHKPVFVKQDRSFVYAVLLPTAKERVHLQKQKQEHLIPTKEELIEHLTLITEKEKKKKLSIRHSYLSNQ